MGDKKLWVPGAYRGSYEHRTGGGGGGGALTLPYLKTFEDDTIGQAPVGWTSAGYTTTPTVNPTVIATPTDVGAYTPAATKCMQLPVTATESVMQNFALPGVADVSAGFRMVAWIKGEVEQQASVNFALLDTPLVYPTPSSNGIRWEVNTVSGQRDLYSWAYVDGVTGTQYDPATDLSDGLNNWFTVRVEWNNVTKKLTQRVYKTGPEFLRHQITDVTPSWSAAQAMTSAASLWVFAYKEANVYVRDNFYTGFWLGKLTDDYPAIKMPLSL